MLTFIGYYLLIGAIIFTIHNIMFLIIFFSRNSKTLLELAAYVAIDLMVLSVAWPFILYRSIKNA